MSENWIAVPNQQKFSYSFDIYPTWNAGPGLKEWLRMQPRVQLEFTEAEFVEFVSGLRLDGFEPRDVERQPYYEPVSVQIPPGDFAIWRQK
jgi:hypothetical protein